MCRVAGTKSVSANSVYRRVTLKELAEELDVDGYPKMIMQEANFVGEEESFPRDLVRIRSSNLVYDTFLNTMSKQQL